MLSRKLEQSFVYKGRKINLSIFFNNVLCFYELQADDMYNQQEKVDMGFNLLCYSKHTFNTQEKIEILSRIFKDYINVLSYSSSGETTKSFDFIQDAGYIYSSFMLDYRIDLYDEIDKLDWRKFIWLFEGLSKDCKIKEVIKIRTMELPKPTKNNRKEIQNIQRLKAIYALKLSENEREKQFADSLKAFARRFVNGN